MKVVISSGHGKYSAGASGVLNEVTENRRVVPKVAEYLRKMGVEVAEFHEDSGRTAGQVISNIVAYHNAQTRDLDVSVHFNAYKTTSEPMGTEVLYRTEQTLAARVSRAIADTSGLKNRGAKLRNDLTFLNGTKKPAILLEVCFVDSAADAAIYLAKFDEICRTIAEAISGKTVSQGDNRLATNSAAIRGLPVVPPEVITAFIQRNNPTFNKAIPEAFDKMGKLYNIKSDIAICQSIKETGWFKYGGGTAVTPDQNNFCGMGVTSLGVKGNSFATVEAGAEAQIQHLFAYCCKDPIPNNRPVVSPRFGLVTRGIAPNWTDLNGKWAVPGTTYGQDILRIYDDLTKFAATYKPVAAGKTNLQGETMSENKTKTVQATLGGTKYILDGKPINEDTLVYGGTAYLPAAVIFRLMGASAVYDTKTNITIVNTSSTKS